MLKKNKNQKTKKQKYQQQIVPRTIDTVFDIKNNIIYLFIFIF